RGYRLAARPGAVTRRAISLLGEDTDALEEAWEIGGLRGSGHPVKVQAPGPLTLAAQLELGNGHRAITDPGALRDLAGSLGEGLRAHRAELCRRLDTQVVVQLDEPALTAAVTGRLAGVTSLSPVPAIDEAVATALLDGCADTVGGEVIVHSCAAELPWNVLQSSRIAAVSLDCTTTPVDYDGIGAFIESGRTVVFGLIPAVQPTPRPAVEEIAAAAAAITDRIGFARSVLAERVGISPVCGLAGATAQWARTAIGLVRQVGEALAGDPEAI
ncbi:methionine synthase, partial [Mycolicibacter algericus]